MAIPLTSTKRENNEPRLLVASEVVIQSIREALAEQESLEWAKAKALEILKPFGLTKKETNLLFNATPNDLFSLLNE